MSGRATFRFRVLIPALALLVAGRYPVVGQVTYEDGSPVETGTVIGTATVDGKAVGVQGNIEKDGSFTWGSNKPGDGAPVGTYKVIVQPRALGDVELSEGKRPAVAGKYTRFDSSGLTFEVKSEKNVFNITVSRPKPKGE